MKSIITLGIFDSWERISEKIAIKTIDRTVISTKESGIPKDMREFFGVEDLKYGEKIEINIYYKQEIFEGELRTTKVGQPKIHWRKSLANKIEEVAPNAMKKFDDKVYTKEVAPKMKFTKMGSKTYKLELIELGNIEIGYKGPNFIVDEFEGLEEGEKVYRINKYYERNTENREIAIKHHGTTCYVCGFNFEDVYGDLGKDYIEIHHKTPLYTLEKAVIINPIKDLVPVCANCHRMIHRDRKNFKDVDELKALIDVKVIIKNKENINLEKELEKDLYSDIVRIYKDTEIHCNYRASRFLQVINDKGALVGTKELINKSGGTEGFIKLWECQRLDLSLEYLVLNNKYRKLFTDKEREICKERLKEFGFEV